MGGGNPPPRKGEIQEFPPEGHLAQGGRAVGHAGVHRISVELSHRRLSM
jgi:hypothetical protein